MDKFALTLYAIDRNPERPVWQICDMYGPFKDNAQIEAFINHIDPQAKTIKDVLVVNGELFSRTDKKLIPKKPLMLTASQ